MRSGLKFSESTTVQKWYLFLVIPGIIFNFWSMGYIMKEAYGWFVLSQITNLPVFTLYQFIGFALFLRLVLNKNTTALLYKSEERRKFEKTDDYFLQSIGILYFAPWFTWFILWLIQKVIY